MNKLVLPIVGLAALALVGFGYAVTSGDDEPATNSAETTLTNDLTGQDQDSQPQELIVSDDGKTVAYSGVANEDALTTIRGLTDVVTEESEFGEFVTTINGVKANSSSEFWAFYVNGSQASVGADSYIAESGDAIEWKLESF